MPRYEWPQGFTASFFSPREFDHPELIDPNFVLALDRIRLRCGFPIKVNDDARTWEEHTALYADEIAAGDPFPTESAHLHDTPTSDPTPVRAVDIRPAGRHDTPINRMRLLFEILRLHFIDGLFPNLGLIVETGHIHVDDCERLADSRPYLGVGVSR